MNRKIVLIVLLMFLVSSTAVYSFAPSGGTSAMNSNSINLGSSLVLMTFNIKHGGLSDLNRIKYVIDTYSPDIVALQEVDRFNSRSSNVDQFTQLKTDLNYQYAYFSDTFYPSTLFGNRQYGLVLFSTIPFSSQTTVPYVYQDTTDPNEKYEKRVYQKVTVNINNKIITIFNTHLTAIDANIRKKQIEELYTAVSKEVGPVMIMGDFNDESTSMDSFKSLFVNVMPSGNTYSTSITSKSDLSNIKESKLDYLFLSNKHFEIKDSKVIFAQASDHDPIYATVELKDTTKQNYNILHLGDSHTIGSYGTELHKYLFTSFQKVITIGVCGATSLNYLNGIASNCAGDKSSYIEDSNAIKTSQTDSYNYDFSSTSNLPDIVIISLGTNYLNGNGVKNGKVTEYLAKLPSTAVCYWVGAPLSTATNVNAAEINSELKKIVEPRCKFIDSTTLTSTSDLTSGGIHYTSTGGQKWAQGVFALLLVNYEIKTVDASIGSVSVSSPTSSSTVTKTKKITISGCASVDSCSYIDEVWKEIVSLVNINRNGQVWDPVNKKYVAVDDYYYDTKTVDSGSSIPVTVTASTKKDYDTYFLRYGTSEIPASVLKALATKESSLNHLLIGSSGEIGLFQFMASTAKGYFTSVTDCCQQESTESTVCENEIKQNGGKVWTTGSSFSCSPSNDNRFNPELNIQAGAKFVKNNYDYFSKRYDVATTQDNLKLALAAHNLGAGGVEQYVKQVKAEGQSITWDNVANKMAGTKPHSKTNSGDRKEVMNAYVNGILSLAQIYKAQLGS